MLTPTGASSQAFTTCPATLCSVIANSAQHSTGTIPDPSDCAPVCRSQGTCNFSSLLRQGFPGLSMCIIMLMWGAICFRLSQTAAARLQLGRAGCSGILDETLDLLATLSRPEQTQEGSAGSSEGTSPPRDLQVWSPGTLLTHGGHHAFLQTRPLKGAPVLMLIASARETASPASWTALHLH